MRTLLLLLGALLALGVLNFAIWQKEKTLASGETVYLKLAPVDPRSLMQGDYMVLRYEVANEIRKDALEAVGGKVVITIDETKIATYVRANDDTPLKPEERLLAYKNRRGAKFGIESFFFQEGKGSDYETAEYAEVRLSDNGSAILINLVQSP